jgi:hypothetical protein
MAAVLTDLDYYGFPDVDPSLFHGKSPIDEGTEIQGTIKELQLKKACLLFASECFASILRKESVNVAFPFGTADFAPIFWATSFDVRLQVLNNCLAAYGLYVVGANWNNHVTLGRRETEARVDHRPSRLRVQR